MVPYPREAPRLLSTPRIASKLWLPGRGDPQKYGYPQGEGDRDVTERSGGPGRAAGAADPGAARGPDPVARRDGRRDGLSPEGSHLPRPRTIASTPHRSGDRSMRPLAGLWRLTTR